MTTPVATTTVTITQALPADVAEARGIAVADRDAGDVLQLEHDIAVELVRLDYARFGSAATDAGKGSMGEPAVRRVTAALDFGAIPAGGSATMPVNVPRARVGDLVAVDGPDGLDAGLVLAGSVTAVNTVTLVAANTTALAVDPLVGDFAVAVINSRRR